jgi:hypothetical protein
MKDQSYTSTPPVGRTACTEPQCLYKGALYLTVELYLYSPYRPCGLYRASVPYKGALYLTVELYLYSPYGPYGLYRASVPYKGAHYLFSAFKELCGLSLSRLDDMAD